MTSSSLHRFRIVTGGLALAAVVAVQAQPTKAVCNVEDVKQDAARNNSLQVALSAPLETGRCSSLVNILRQIVNGKIRAGRQLEGERTLDTAAAERQLASARANSEIQAAVDAELQGAKDPDQRLLLEAVVMHDKRQLLARDLLLQRMGSK